MGGPGDQGGGRWPRLARRLGLTLLTRKRPVARARCLVGLRRGRLVAIWPSHALNSSSVDILVRYPQRSTIRGMRESMLRDPDLAAAFGRKRAVPRSRQKDLFVGDGMAVLRLSYTFFPPRTRRIEAVLDGLISALDRESRPLERVCEACGQVRDPDVYLVDGFPGFFCGDCVTRHDAGESERAEWMRSMEADLRQAAGLGLGAALAFGLVAGALASIAVSKIGMPALFDVSSTIVLLLAAGLGYAIGLFTHRGLNSFRVAPMLLAVPFLLLGAAIFAGAMWLVARQTLEPVPYSPGLIMSAFWNEPFRHPRLTLAIAAACGAGWLVAFATRLAWILRARRRSQIERVAGV